VNDILDLTKLQARRMHIEREPFDLLGELHALVSEFRHQPSNATRELQLEVSGPVPRWVLGDRMRMRQVVRNLLANAFKFTRENGHVALRLEAFALEEARVRLRVSVEDDGIGIPMEAQARIFDRFEQVDASTTRRYGGTGLGLAICRQLVDVMGGSIGVESELGRGSTFWFDVELECSNRDTVGPPVPEAPPFAISGRRILLVEDLRINQIVAGRLLGKMGCDVDVAANGIEALDLLTRQSFDAVLMDCFMPEMDGFEATRQLRALEARQPGRSRTPVIALTAAVTEADRQRCVEAGMDAFVPKPIHEAALEQALAQACRLRA
jgi:CheY-like chemotaxis protein